MTKTAKFRPTLGELQNPYASLQMEADLTALSPRQQWALSENPYAHDFYLGPNPGPEPYRVDDPPVADVLKRQSRVPSRAEFDRELRTIFRTYMPAEERAQLRPHYRAFIDRNKNRSPRVRAALIAALTRYDLSVHPGLNPQFNREDESLTDEKLRAIEAQVNDDAE